MTEYYTYAKFISCTDLVEFQNSPSNKHKMMVYFNIPPTVQYKYTKIEIYRYVGPYMTYVDPSSINEDNLSSIKIYSATQQFIADDYSGQVITEQFFPYTTPPQTLNVNLTGISSFIDDYSVLIPTSDQLRVRHKLSVLDPGNANNFHVTNDIGFTRRTVYYIIKTYVKGAVDSAPYFLTPDYKRRTFANHSTKTQVRHDYLHYEGDEIWLSNLTGEALYDSAYEGLSRTAVDVNRLYLDALQAGPIGRGGYAWVSDRSSGKAFRHNLKDGAVEQIFATGTPSRGGGIGVDIETGNAIYCPGQGTATDLWLCNISTGVPERLKTGLGGTHGYGVVPLFGKPDRMLVTSYKNAPRIVYHRIRPKENIVLTVGDSIEGYAACSSPNGRALQSIISPGLNNVAVINYDTAKHYKKVLSATPIGGGSTIEKNSSRITVDSHSLYPNTIITPGGSRDKYTIMSTHEFGVDIPDTDISTDAEINWAVRMPTPDGTREAMGYDGENNLWVVSEGGYKQKIYRTAGNRNMTPGVNDEYVFPYGGYSRYPTASLEDWPMTFTNTTEIEWFLTRNHRVETLRQDINAQYVIDTGTLDNSLTANWDPDRDSIKYNISDTLNKTASAAWWSMVEEKMYRKHIDPLTWDISTFFGVYRSDNTVLPKNKKWGIRMKVTDIYTSSPMYSATYLSEDAFYENGRSVWLPEVLRRIRAWSAAFANDTTSYVGETNRISLITNNRTGILVHPFYQYATAATNGTSTDYYINPSLSTTQQSQLITYINNLKTYKFSNKVSYNVYMYSDFTGNILVGAVDTMPINRNIIYPARTNPSLSLCVSGYQSNPGYQETIPRCYPWKNTLPVSMSAMYEGVTGYDDFNIAYCVSTYNGSYLLTSFSVRTDDYYPSYLTDIGNLTAKESIINQTYLTDNNYTNVIYLDYTYHSPSVNGLWYLPSGTTTAGVYEYLYNADGRVNGVFEPNITINVIDLYTNTTITQTDTATVKVLERWPEPKFYLDVYDLPEIRYGMFCHNSWGYVPGSQSSRYNKSDYLYHESRRNEALRYDTVYGVDPISARIQDVSIARTWPISSWQLTLSTDNFRLGWIDNMQTFEINTNEVLNVLQDAQNMYDLISSTEFRYGNYVLTMIVAASTTGTASQSADKPFIQYINVSEFEPFANFWAVSAYTVPSTYVATDSSINDQLVNVNPIHNGVITVDGVTYPFVSGYAPNLTVYFKDSSEAHTFPISSYHWDFGDPFNEGPLDITDISSNYYTITDVGLLAGNFTSGCWFTTAQQHTAVHTYIMPGTYDVTLTVRASCTSTSDVCARYIGAFDDNEKFYVHVEEIMPTCGGGIYGSLSPVSGFTNASGGIGGGSPLTAYFMSSGIIAGSFPICRIDWDFGDGNVQRITRRPLTQITDQGLSVINISAYAYDIDDPRNIIIPHVYINQTESSQSFNINISAYACNTNSLLHCFASNLVSPVSAEIEQPITDVKRLIGSRFDDDGNLIYIIEGQDYNTTYTIALSGELT